MFRQINFLRWTLALALLALPGAARAADGSAPEPAPEPPRLISLASTTPIAIVVGQPVQFLDESTGSPTNWVWDFSYDPAQPAWDSIAQNPVWTFNQTGVYPVHLQVCNSSDCSETLQDVTVVEPCTLQGDLVLPDVSPAVYDTTTTYEACHTITTSGVLTIDTSGDVTFLAGHTIAFGSGFSVASGAHFKAVIDFTLDTP